MNHELTGLSIIGSSRGKSDGSTFHAFDPHTGSAVEPSFYSASISELEYAAELAEMARIPFGNSSGLERGELLRAIADTIEALGKTLSKRA